MSGPTIVTGKQLFTAVEARKVSMRTIDESVRLLLELIKRLRCPRALIQGITTWRKAASSPAKQR